MSDRIVERVLNAVGAYDALGVHPDTELNKVKKIYRKTCLQLHPDKCKHPRATEAFQKLGTLVVELEQFAGDDVTQKGPSRWRQWHERAGGGKRAEYSGAGAHQRGRQGRGQRP